MSDPVFTAHLRGNDPGASALAESERLRRHETSRAYRLTERLRALRGKPALPRTTLQERRDAVEVIAADRVYRAWVGARRLRPGGRATAPDPSQRIDDAIETLKVVPWQELQRRGWNFQPNHFYWPLNDHEFLAGNAPLWHDRGHPREIEWDTAAQAELWARLSSHAPELDDVPERADPGGPAVYQWRNNAFGGDDAKVYYGLIRELAPKRVVEVGCGWSSLILDRAIGQNATPTQVTQIEPFPDERIFAALPREWVRHEVLIQHAPFDPFKELEADDVLFYDGSHCVKTASDVNWLFFEVLPRLRPGVWVHIHDVFFPDDYHDEWVLEEGLSWNEQYLLQAFLMNNDSWRVRFACRMAGGDGGSVWLQRTQ
ncbi:MAG: class I SAM-dependent methyltransferase [Thermoleophilaceae bacterium]|nr:class I SAM-dependent methyltransferase [Thermoleophilaceae bacterium]